MTKTPTLCRTCPPGLQSLLVFSAFASRPGSSRSAFLQTTRAFSSSIDSLASRSGAPLGRLTLLSRCRTRDLAWRRSFSSDGLCCRLRMAGDGDYMSFLDKANQDWSDGQALAKEEGGRGEAKAVFKTADQGMRAPEVIREACKDAVYVTDADEAFDEVSLKWDGNGLPDEAEFAKLIGHWDPDSADISITDPLDWDSRGQYSNLIEAVREATKGNDVRVYCVVRDQTRTEYWLISREEGRIVGAKALGVES